MFQKERCNGEISGELSLHDAARKIMRILQAAA